MKNQLSLFVATLATLFITLTASAQGEWKWAHYWSGTDAAVNQLFNFITNTAFDEEGNLYVYGSVGADAHYDGQALAFPGNSDVSYNTYLSSLLAKFDTAGNMLWYKMVSSDGYESQPMWMELRGNNIYITGASGMSWDGNYWNFFLDSLIRKADVMNLPESERKPPYKNSRWTFFARLDLDGHVQERHFIEAYSRELIFGELRQVLPLCIGRRYRTPMHVDDMGNVHLFARFYYTGEENNPYTIVIDGDTNRTIDLYLPGGSCNEQPRFNVMVYKFAPNWELEFARLMIEHTEGIASSWEFTYDSIYPSFSPFVEGLSFDEQDNMYVSGYIKITMSSSDHGGNLHQYPIHIYWDSTHYATIQDMSSAQRLNYLIKYNPQGEVQWCNQIYTRGSSEGSNRASAVWERNCLHGNYLYLNGAASYYEENGALVYFDNESNYLPHYQQERAIGFFVKYDKTTGAFVNSGIMHAKGNVWPVNAPACINNRVFALNTSGESENNQVTLTCHQLTTWRDDGLFISADTIQAVYTDIELSEGLVANENGYIAVSLTARAPVTFSNDVTADCYSPGLSSAVIALYHNPEFAQPFVPDDSVGIDEYYQNRERDIYISPNPTSGPTSVHGYMYGYQSIELYDLQGRKLADLVEAWQPSNASTMQPIPAFDLSPYPSGTYLVKINFERGVSVVRKVVRM